MDHPEQYTTILIRTTKSIKKKLKKLAGVSGTDLTGYLNAVVFTNHINIDANKTILADDSKSGEPRSSQ